MENTLDDKVSEAVCFGNHRIEHTMDNGLTYYLCCDSRKCDYKKVLDHTNYCSLKTSFDEDKIRQYLL
jgi:hypothetical protein